MVIYIIVIVLDEIREVYHLTYAINLSGHNAQLDKENLKGRDSWKEDIIYLFKNKSFMFSSIGFTFLTFFTGGLSWWGPHYIESALLYRNETLSDTSSDPEFDK